MQLGAQDFRRAVQAVSKVSKRVWMHADSGTVAIHAFGDDFGAVAVRIPVSGEMCEMSANLNPKVICSVIKQKMSTVEVEVDDKAIVMYTSSGSVVIGEHHHETIPDVSRVVGYPTELILIPAKGYIDAYEHTYRSAGPEGYLGNLRICTMHAVPAVVCTDSHRAQVNAIDGARWDGDLNISIPIKHATLLYTQAKANVLGVVRVTRYDNSTHITSAYDAIVVTQSGSHVYVATVEDCNGNVAGVSACKMTHSDRYPATESLKNVIEPDDDESTSYEVNCGDLLQLIEGVNCGKGYRVVLYTPERCLNLYGLDASTNTIKATASYGNVACYGVKHAPQCFDASYLRDALLPIKGMWATIHVCSSRLVVRCGTYRAVVMHININDDIRQAVYATCK